MASLRQRITLGVVGITSGVVLIAALGTWFIVESFVSHNLDLELEKQADIARKFPVREPMLRPQRDSRLDQRRPAQIVTATGEELMRTNALDEQQTLDDPTIPLNQPITRAIGTERRLLRILAVQVDNSNYRAYVAVDLDAPNAELQRLAWVLAGLWATATILAWFGVTLIEPLMLRPLLRLRAAIDRLGPEDLAGRIPDAVGPDEFRGLVGRLNQLLARLEEAFRREQTTIANIAHELRTPVTVLRTTLEFRLLATTQPQEIAVLQTCFRTVERMQAIVSNLLLLARLEAGSVELERIPIDLEALIRDQVEIWLPQAQLREQKLTCNIEPGVSLTTSAEHMRQVIDNLLNNALSHSPAGATITITCTNAELCISNPCVAQIDPEQLGRVFYRADAARSAGEHAGLGLALCQRLIALIGGQLEFLVAQQTFTARVHFNVSRVLKQLHVHPANALAPATSER